MEAIGVRKASERTGLSAHTLRYYERAGLIGSVRREASGKRTYSETDLLWLAFLRRLRATGMSVAQMRQFATLRAAGDATTGDRRLLLEEHSEFIRGQIASLTENLEILERKIGHFRQEERAAPRYLDRSHRDAAASGYGQERVGEEPALIILGLDEGRTVQFRGATIVRKVDGSDTGGRWAVGEARQPPGFENSPHSHTEPEAFYVLEGRFTLFGSGEVTLLGPGSFVLIKAGEVHGFRAGEQGGRFLAIWPGQMDGYFEEMIAEARAGKGTPAAMGEIGHRHGVTGHGLLPNP